MSEWIDLHGLREIVTDLREKAAKLRGQRRDALQEWKGSIGTCADALEDAANRIEAATK